MKHIQQSSSQIPDQDSHEKWGLRSGREEKLRWAGLVCLLIIVIVAEFSLGRHFENKALKSAHQNPNWARAIYRAPVGTMSIPEKKPGIKRILFVSNSHAVTGGKVPHHLQDLLNRVQPDSFEVLNLARPGIFAPDMLQRVLFGMDLEPDLLILSVAYISFSDMMPLALQSHGVRSFFKPGVFRRLRPGFWWRNYDIGIMSETLVSSRLRLYRYRNLIRNLWEEPVVRWLGGDDQTHIQFLDVDQDQRWRFPEGYDNNLCQPRLYSSGRDGHLRDLQDLVDACKKEGLPVLAFNLPIDWRKTFAERDTLDFELYIKQVSEILSKSEFYINYQDCFPVGFTSYDSVHPTVFGARLHALDLCLRLQQRGVLTCSVSHIINEFVEMEPAISSKYADMVSKPSRDEREGIQNFDIGNPVEEKLRFDLSGPDTASHLLSTLSATRVSSDTEMFLLYSISRRIIFWRSDLTSEAGCTENFAPEWASAVESEMTKFRKRAMYFSNALTTLQNLRLQDFPLPEDLRHIQPTRIGTVQIEDTDVRAASFDLEDGRTAVAFTTLQGEIIAYQVFHPDQRPDYVRIDLLGDGSFILKRSINQDFLLPMWMLDKESLLKWDW